MTMVTRCPLAHLKKRGFQFNVSKATFVVNFGLFRSGCHQNPQLSTFLLCVTRPVILFYFDDRVCFEGTMLNRTCEAIVSFTASLQN